MREIKFRIWDIRRKEWALNGLNITFPIGMLSKSAIEHGFVLMQYTGLKDKNGKEIYEGDIVSDGIMEQVVFWDQYKCAFRLYKPNSVFNPAPRYDLLQSGVSRIEIIGNIYENENLIK